MLRDRTIFNGNGKLPEELRLAIEAGALINVDSEFDLENIAAAAAAVDRSVPSSFLLLVTGLFSMHLITCQCSPVLQKAHLPVSSVRAPSSPYQRLQILGWRSQGGARPDQDQP